MWDVLTTDVERPVHLVWHDARASEQAMGTDAFSQSDDLFSRVEA